MQRVVVSVSVGTCVSRCSSSLVHPRQARIPGGFHQDVPVPFCIWTTKRKKLFIWSRRWSWFPSHYQLEHTGPRPNGYHASARDMQSKAAETVRHAVGKLASGGTKTRQRSWERHGSGSERGWFLGASAMVVKTRFVPLRTRSVWRSGRSVPFFHRSCEFNPAVNIYAFLSGLGCF